MARESVETHRETYDARSCAYYVGYDEQEADYFSQYGTADDISHVCDGVAVSMSVAEVALYNGEVWKV
jgi:hypothetical protein